MLKFIKKHKLVFIISLILVILTICLSIFFITRSKEPEDVISNDTFGNTPGNLYNKGQFCEDGNTIYFSNYLDGGCLYSMSNDLDNFKKISKDNVSYINVNNKYIFYSRMNLDNSSSVFTSLLNTSGLYRCDKKGKQLLSLYEEPSGLVSQYGNYVYYQHYNNQTGLTMYKVRIDGDGELKISDHAILPGSFIGDNMYYSEMDNNHFIYEYNTKLGTSKVFLEKRSMYPIINGDYIYYISIDDNYGIYRYPTSGGEPECLVNNYCSSYNITDGGRYLYYQIDELEDSKFCRLDLETKENTILMTGNYCNINITTNYVFFSTIGGYEYYYLEHDTNIAKEFKPEIID